jgi:hypothetical protein
MTQGVLEMSRFALRTIRNGRVRIDGREYAVSEKHELYDGRLDGRRYLFAKYAATRRAVALWGTEAAYLATRRNAPQEAQEAYERGECDGPEVVDGRLPWMWWDEIRNDAA